MPETTFEQARAAQVELANLYFGKGIVTGVFVYEVKWLEDLGVEPPPHLDRHSFCVLVQVLEEVHIGLIPEEHNSVPVFARSRAV